MLFYSDKLFTIVRSAKLGRVELPIVLEYLRKWIVAEFEVQVVYIYFDHVELGPCKDRPRLNVILETDDDYNSWKTDAVTIVPEVSRSVILQFRKLATVQPETYDTDDVFLTLDNFSAECLRRANDVFLERQAKNVVKEFSFVPIWYIDGLGRDLVVFLNTEIDISKYAADGICAEISKRCYEFVKLHDEFDYLSAESFSLRFDSKEKLDRIFKGNLHDYWR